MIIHTPRGIQVEEVDGTMQIIRKWYSPIYIFLMLFTLSWNAFFIYYIFIYKTQEAGESTFNIMPYVNFVIGFGLLYYNITGLINKTTITLKHKKISVRNSPLPWPGNMEIKSEDVEQLFVKENIRRTKSSVIILFNVFIITKKNKRVKLVKNLDDKDQALYIEAILEDKLHIQDRVIPDEVEK